ncbi:predicted protein [Nematostella vectensis]|uniref:BZIP domain-containing protein n=1 Tax=Nematostella vectensis TaxID=45351 RepID=A7RIQ6_NEMVE|nr:predicted protein [Nematostella vectensis]|eukprot:XP_001640903.1 predicted protein [Nematostella vectensis]
MDVPFYEDEIMPIDSSSENTMYDKTALKLDFSNSGSNRRQNTLNSFDNSILTSPDLNLLKLASPELEKLIIANCGVLTTPTPQGLKNSNLTVTEQQELYARGFLEALQKLHEQQGSPSSVVSAFPLNQTCATTEIQSTKPMSTQANFVNMSTATRMINPLPAPACTQGITAPTYTTNMLTTISTEALPLDSIANNNVASQIFPEFQTPGIIMSIQQQLNTNVGSYGFSNRGRFGEIKMEEQSQVVPHTPPLPPIDLDLQEAVKNERKKLRNRLAASKCRKRKLEKEAELEDKVKVLKDKNTKLVSEAQELRRLVCELKEQVMNHVSGGCQVYPKGLPSVTASA